MDVSLTQDGPRYTVRFERRLAHSPEKVWRALTERELLQRWFPSDVEGDWTTGAKLRFTFESGESEPIEGEVLTVEPPRLLEFRWGDSILRYELTADEGGCRLVFSETFATFDLGAWRVLFEGYVGPQTP